jgi:Uma2 family endonuclease
LINFKKSLFLEKNNNMALTIETPISEYELERGKPMPSKNHGLIQGNLTGVLFYLYRQQYSILPEVSLEMNGKVYTPDICIYPKMVFDGLNDEIKLTQAPLVAIEILSPTQGTEVFEEKFPAYFAHGVRSCWFVEPMIRAITVFTDTQNRTVFSDGILLDSSTNIEINLQEIFI